MTSIRDDSEYTTSVTQLESVLHFLKLYTNIWAQKGFISSKYSNQNKKYVQFCKFRAVTSIKSTTKFADSNKYCTNSELHDKSVTVLDIVLGP